MTQLALFSAPPPAARPRPATGKRPSITERWEEFHAANPHVMDEMLRLARERLAEGATYLSVKALWETCRITLATEHGEYKLDNSLTSIVARELIAREPRLDGVVRLRRRRSK